jgi:iron complex outermembrane receptor protein
MLQAAAGILAALFVSLSFAQEDAVVITATRFPDAKRDLPVGVTLITADDIRKSASSNLPEILAQFGLVNIRDNTGSPNSQVDLRGFGITGDQNTLILVDGIRVSDNELSSAQLNAIPLESIERIEIVRGGGAVLYGGGASGGTINIITRRMQPGEARAYGVARAGGYGTRELRAGFRRMEENLGVSLDVSNENTDGYRRNNEFRQTNVAGMLEAQGDGARAYLRVALGRQDAHLPGALTEAQIAADPRQQGGFLGTVGRDDDTVTLGGAGKAGRHDWAADLSYHSKDAPAHFAGFDVDTRVKQWSLLPRGKLRFDALGREHDVTLGVDVEDWDLDSRNTFGRRTGEQTNRAVYALVNLWPAERTRVVLGGRLQHSEVSLTPDSASHRFSAYEAALRQHLAGGWSAYGKLATSFRLATFDEICFAACAGPLLEPQTARSGELGAEYEARGLRLRAAVYEMHLRNEIYFSPLVFDNINLSPTQRRGLEIEAAGRMTQALELRAALALQEATFRSGTYGGTDVSGKDIPLVPEMIATAGASWSFSSMRRLNVNGRYVGHQRYDNDQANTFAKKMPAYALVDAKLAQRVGRFEFAFEVRNLFDKNYYSYGIWNGATSFSAYPQSERTAYLSLAYRLD